MIENRIVPNINIFSKIQESMPIDEFSQKGFGMSNVEQPSFKNILSGMVSNLNNEIQKPDQLLSEQMLGSSEVDIHDVMTAVAKAELGVSLATQVTSKVITAYNSVMSISI